MRRRSAARRPLPPGFSVLLVTVAVDAVGFGIVVPILALYADEFGAGPVAVGMVVASYSLAQLVMAPLLGRWSDRVGRRPVLILALAGSAAGSLITGLAGSLAVVFLGRVVDGASGASVAVARAATADLAEPDERPRLFGLLGAVFGAGFVLGPALGGLAALGGHRLPFFLAAAIAGTNALVAVRRLPETRAALPAEPGSDVAVRARGEVPPEPETTSRPESEVREWVPALVQLLVVSFVATAALGAFEATFPLLAEDRVGVDLSSIGLVFAAVGLGVVLVRGLLVAPVGRWLGEPAALRLGLALNGVGLVALAPAASWPALSVGLALVVVGQGLLLPFLSSTVAGLAPPGRSGGAMGWQQSAQSLARVAGPAAAGLLFTADPGAPFLVGGALSMLVLVLVPGPARLDAARSHRLPYITTR